MGESSAPLGLQPMPVEQAGQGAGEQAAAANVPFSDLSGATRDSVYAGLGDELLQQYCFAAGTLVLTDRGLRPIEKIERGELVWSVPDGAPESAGSWQPVVNVFHNAPAHLWNIHVGPDLVVRATDNHPWFVGGVGWVATRDLHLGDQMRTSSGGWARVTDKFDNGEIEPVYNLHVASGHTYFVGDERRPVLVHNDSPDPAAVQELGSDSVGGDGNVELTGETGRDLAGACRAANAARQLGAVVSEAFASFADIFKSATGIGATYGDPIPIGTLVGSNVRLSAAYGGATVPLAELKRAAATNPGVVPGTPNGDAVSRAAIAGLIAAAVVAGEFRVSEESSAAENGIAGSIDALLQPVEAAVAPYVMMGQRRLA